MRYSLLIIFAFLIGCETEKEPVSNIPANCVLESEGSHTFLEYGSQSFTSIYECAVPTLTRMECRYYVSVQGYQEVRCLPSSSTKQGVPEGCSVVESQGSGYSHRFLDGDTVAVGAYYCGEFQPDVYCYYFKHDDPDPTLFKEEFICKDTGFGPMGLPFYSLDHLQY